MRIGAAPPRFRAAGPRRSLPYRPPILRQGRQRHPKVSEGYARPLQAEPEAVFRFRRRRTHTSMFRGTGSWRRTTPRAKDTEMGAASILAAGRLDRPICSRPEGVPHRANPRHSAAQRMRPRGFPAPHPQETPGRHNRGPNKSMQPTPHLPLDFESSI